MISCCSGCASSSSGTDGSGHAVPPKSATRAPAPTPGSAQLTLLSDSPVRLGFAEQVRIAVQLADADGAAIADGHVSFALVGRAQDASLASLDATTDQDGTAENTLIAGKMSAAFRVRISAPGAYDTFVDVAVSNSGFGTLAVSMPYSGARMVAQRAVYAQAAMSCMQAARMVGDPMVTLSSSDDVARFLALPAGQQYAVTAVAQSKDGTTLARGCTDAVTVRADAEVMVSVDFTDEPLVLAGKFSLQADLDSSVPAITLSNALRAAAEAAVQNDAKGLPSPTDAEGRFLLDSLDGTLRSDAYAALPGVAALAMALSQARMQANSGTASPDHSLQSLLSINSEGPLSAAPRLAELAGKSLATTHVLATVSLSSKDAKRPVSWLAQRIDALPISAGGSPPSVDLSSMQQAADTQARFVPAKDLLELTAVRFHAQLGALTAQALTKAVAADKLGHGDEIRALIGCATLSEWLAQQSYAKSSACDASCVQASCDRATARLVGAAQTALMAVDDARPTLTLHGQLVLSDDNGDLVAERLSAATLSGQWDPEPSSGQGDSVSGAANAPAAP
jgi:hypothetical protein